LLHITNSSYIIIVYIDLYACKFVAVLYDSPLYFICIRYTKR